MMFAGVVLAGGQSRRMGRTKAVVEVDGRKMADRVIDALRDAGCERVVVYGGDPAELAVLDAPFAADRFPGAGPLGGIVGALTMFFDAGHASDASGDVAGVADGVTDGVVVVPCDVPDLDGSVLDPLLDAASRVSSTVDAVVARTDRIEPMCAVWMQSAVPQVRGAFDAGERTVHRVLDALVTIEVDVPAPGLRNVNRPGDLDDRSDAQGGR